MEISLLKMHLSLLLLLEYNVISMWPTQPASTERLFHDLPSPVPQAGCVLAVLSACRVPPPALWRLTESPSLDLPHHPFFISFIAPITICNDLVVYLFIYLSSVFPTRTQRRERFFILVQCCLPEARSGL